MTTTRWKKLPATCVIVGALTACAAAFATRETLGGWQWAVYVGGIISLAGIYGFRRRLDEAEIELHAAQEKLVEQQAAIAAERAQLVVDREETQRQLEHLANRIDRREQELANKLVAYHTWLESPEAVELPALTSATAEELTELAKKDRQMFSLLESESAVLFQNIRNNKYVVDDKFQLRLARDDVYVLAEKVARIYRPESDHPLIETSIEQLLRAAVRASLQLMVVLDELPLDVKSYNLNRMYTYVRQAVKAYGVYKSAEVYWPYVNSAYYLGRMVFGASPISLGAWWLVREAGRQGAKAVATQLVNRQALAFLHSLVRIIGCEVASIYGANFRYRDANWIFAAELTELLASFPVTRESLSQALKEVANLQLRSEYDRVYLFRCLAMHTSAKPDRYLAAASLTAEERQMVARRLEKFLDAQIHTKTPERVAKWRAAAEPRLGIKLATESRPLRPLREQVEEALRSLSGFLIEIKDREVDELPTLLASTKLLAKLPESDRQSLFRLLQESPPYFYSPPDLDRASKVVGDFLDDFVCLAVRTPPFAIPADEVVIDAAATLGHDVKAIRTALDQQFVSLIADRLPPESPAKKLPLAAARAITGLLSGGENLRFVYGDATVEWPAVVEDTPSLPEPLWLTGIDDRLLLVSGGREATVFWRGDRTVRVERTGSAVKKSCRLVGGEWFLNASQPPLSIRITCPLMSGYESHFQALTRFVSQP